MKLSIVRPSVSIFLLPVAKDPWLELGAAGSLFSFFLKCIVQHCTLWLKTKQYRQEQIYTMNLQI